MIEHYLDNSSTTPLLENVKSEVNRIMDTVYGNPSSLHSIGQLAEKEIENSRNIILSTFTTPGTHLQKNNLVFTSCGSEANNLAIIGTSLAKPRNVGKKIITTSTEHDSVLKTVDSLSKRGFKTVYIESPKGKLDEDKLLSEISDDTILVSIMLVNNETGSVNNINELAQKIKGINPNVIVHCDAVQGYMKIPFGVYSKADLISISGHKINSLKGVGALFISPNVNKLRAISPIIYGGGQEFGIRSGTENVAGIVSFGCAVDYYKKNFVTISNQFSNLYSYTIEKLKDFDKNNLSINIPQSNMIAHHIINLTVNGIRSETLLHYLSSLGVYISSGSACASNTNSKSHVLKSFGLSDNEIDSSIRISFGIQNTTDDIDCFIDALKNAISTLQRK